MDLVHLTGFIKAEHLARDDSGTVHRRILRSIEEMLIYRNFSGMEILPSHFSYNKKMALAAFSSSSSTNTIYIVIAAKRLPALSSAVSLQTLLFSRTLLFHRKVSTVLLEDDGLLCISIPAA